MVPRDVRLSMARAATLLAVFAAPPFCDDVSSNAQSERDTAVAVLVKVRAAVAGRNGLQSVGGVSLHGTLKRLVVGGTEAGTVREKALNITIVLPDSYLREETATLGSGTVTHTYGFRADKVLNAVRASGPDMNFGGSWGPEQLDIERAEFARLLLGSLALETSTFPVEFAHSSGAVAPSSPALVLDVTGPRGFAARLFIDKNTYRPVKLTYQAPVRLPPAVLPGKPMGPEALTGPSPAETREVELRFSDHRSVKGIYFPHRIVKRVGDVTLDEIVCHKVIINPTSSPAGLRPDRH